MVPNQQPGLSAPMLSATLGFYFSNFGEMLCSANASLWLAPFYLLVYGTSTVRSTTYLTSLSRAEP